MSILYLIVGQMSTGKAIRLLWHVQATSPVQSIWSLDMSAARWTLIHPIEKLENNAWHYKNRKKWMENSLKCHWTLKNVQTFRAEPFISVKKAHSPSLLIRQLIFKKNSNSYGLGNKGISYSRCWETFLGYTVLSRVGQPQFQIHLAALCQTDY